VFLFANEYDEAMEYLSGKKGLKTYTVVAKKLTDCKGDIECLEALGAHKKKSYTLEVSQISYLKAIKLLQKSYEKGNIKAGHKLLSLYKSLPQGYISKNILEQKEKKLVSGLRKKDKCFDTFQKIKETKAKATKKDFDIYKLYKKAQKDCKKDSLDYSIASKRIQKIEKKIKQESFLLYLWYKIKVFFSNLF
jgi:hypothetical protein